MTPFIPALLAKLTIILALGLVVAATVRSFSPSLRHLVLFATLASCLALPFVMLMSPQWNVPILPRAFATESFPTSALGLAVDDALPNNVSGARTSSPALTAKVIDVGTVRPPSRTADILPALPVLPLLWALGFSAVIGWLAIGRFRLRRIVAGSWPLDGSDWRVILDEERKHAGVAKPVRLFSSSVVSTPLTWGSRHPIILVPEDAIDWAAEHRRIVLRHELAHISRGDSLTQLVAGFICALYWFHPLAWITERRMRAECERACDDSVLSLGTPPAEYAAHLLEVARSARSFGAAGFLSVAMARPSQLEGRLLAVLNESRRRASLSRGVRPAAALLSALVLIPLAAFRPVQTPDKQTPILETPALSPQPTPTTLPSVEPSLGTNRRIAIDTAFQLSVPARSAGTLTIDLKTGGKVDIIGWDKPEIVVRASLAGRDWRETQVRLQPSDGGARLESDFAPGGSSRSSSHTFAINVPRNYNVRISSSGGSLSINGVDGIFTGHTGGGQIDIRKANGEVDIRTGGGKIHVSDSRLNGSVSTGGGIVTIERVSGDLKGNSGSGPVIYTGANAYSVDDGRGSGSSSRSTTTTTTYDNRGSKRTSTFGSSGIRMSSAGGSISLPSAPDGAHVTTGGGRIRIGPSSGEVYAKTGGGSIDIGPAAGSVEAHTGAGDVTIELTGAGSHAVDVTSGKGEVVLVLPQGLDAMLELETAYTDNLGHKTRIVSDWPLQPTETDSWDSSMGTPRRYVRARQSIGRGGDVIRVRTVNGNVVVRRAR
jgi:beta-lactamase regulating signal transducer with metallopeptidase domain